MTSTPITATLPTGYVAPSTATTTPAGQSNAVNSQTFLKLLVAQLQYQSPDSPTDPSQMLSQTAMFQEVQQLQAMTTSMTAMQQSQQAASATSMLGRSVTATPSGATSPITGTVTSVDLSGANGPTLTVGGTTVPLSAVQSVHTAGATQTQPTTTA